MIQQFILIQIMIFGICLFFDDIKILSAKQFSKEIIQNLKDYGQVAKMRYRIFIYKKKQ